MSSSSLKYYSSSWLQDNFWQKERNLYVPSKGTSHANDVIINPLGIKSRWAFGQGILCSLLTGYQFFEAY